MKKVFKPLLTLFGALFISTSFLGAAEPGAWESSGGEIFRFAKNPWFVKNTSTVSYCIQHDDVGFSASVETARASIATALSYWRSEFQQALGRRADMMGTTSLADQTFTETACGPTTDLTFKFGDGTLTPEEKAHLNDVQAFIGVTVRTSYDLENMKGKGFIFVASDQGANPYRNPGHLIERAWQHPKLLSYILLHELGHVFGLPHSGSGLMSEVFADQLLHKNMYASYLDLDFPSMFGSPRALEVCTPFGSFAPDFFKAPLANQCVVVRPAANDPFDWQILTKPKRGAESLVGHLRVQPSTGALSSLQPAVLVHLPPEQTVFNAQERAMMNFVIGAFYMDYNASGIYRTTSSLKPYPVFVQLRPDRLAVLGTLNDKLEPVLEYSPPTLFRLLFPKK